jgi:type IV secretion system protein VirB10
MGFKISFGKEDETPQPGETVAGAPPPAPNPVAEMGSRKQRGSMMLVLGGVLVTVLFITKTCSSTNSAAKRETAVMGPANPAKVKPTAPPTAKQISELTQAYNRVSDEAEKARQLMDQRQHQLGGGTEEKVADGKDPLLVQADYTRQRQEELSGGNPVPADPQVEERRRKQEEEAKSLLSSPLYDQQKTISLGSNDEPAGNHYAVVRPDGVRPDGEGEASVRPVSATARDKKGEPLDFDPARSVVEWLRAGTLMEGVLTNSLAAEELGPVQIVVDHDVYIPYTTTVVIPKGSIALGEAKAVGDQSDERVAVTFHRIITPGRFGYGIPLDRGEPGLSQSGEAGLHDLVNRHYASIFGASLALGAIGGIAQIGNGGGNYNDPASSFRNGVSQSMAQSSNRVLDHILQRRQTLLIRKGNRVEIMLIGDLPVPLPPQSSAPSAEERQANLPPVPRRADSEPVENPQP